MDRFANHVVAAEGERDVAHATADAGARMSELEFSHRVDERHRIFGVLYYGRIAGKKLKRFNRKLYYTVKYLLFALLIWAIFL